MENLIKDNNIYIYIYDGQERLIGKWFGKDLYARAYTGTGSNWIEVDKTFDSSKTLIGGFGVYEQASGKQWYQMTGFYKDSAITGSYFYQNIGVSTLYVVVPGTNLKYKVCVFYTKN